MNKNKILVILLIIEELHLLNAIDNNNNYFQISVYGSANCMANFRFMTTVPTLQCLIDSEFSNKTGVILECLSGEKMLVKTYSDIYCKEEISSYVANPSCLNEGNELSDDISCGKVEVYGVGFTIYSDENCTIPDSTLIVIAEGLCSSSLSGNLLNSTLFKANCNSDQVYFTNYSKDDIECKTPHFFQSYPLNKCINIDGAYVVFNFCGQFGGGLVKTWWFWLALGGGSIGGLLLLILVVVIYTRRTSKLGYSQINN